MGRLSTTECTYLPTSFVPSAISSLSGKSSTDFCKLNFLLAQTKMSWRSLLTIQHSR